MGYYMKKLLRDFLRNDFLRGSSLLAAFAFFVGILNYLNNFLNWLEKEGKEILEKTAREIFPRVAEDVLRKEIARLKEEAGAQEKE